MKSSPENWYNKMSEVYKINMEDIGNKYFMAYLLVVNGLDYEAVEAIIQDEDELRGYLTEFNKMYKENNDNIANLQLTFEHLFQNEKNR
ncbi:MAG: hypothetical protein K6G37_02045 [Bacilli bacterium]|nr:hypothetical protein [Bacilli bacterium]